MITHSNCLSLSDILLIYPPHPFMLLRVATFHSFVWLSSISVVFHLTHTHTHTHTHIFIYTPHLLYPFIHDGYFHVLATVNRLPWTLWCMYLFSIVFLFLFSDIYPGMGLLDHMVILVSVFWETSILFSIMATPIYNPSNSEKGFFFSTSLPTYVTCGFFDDSHSDRYEMISHCGFNLHFPGD